MTNKKKEITIHSSAAEYLTYVAAAEQNGWYILLTRVGMRYRKIWYTYP